MVINNRIVNLFVLVLVSSEAFAQQECDAQIVSRTPNERYEVFSNGTVLDTETDLMWQRCPAGLSGEDCTEGAIITTLGRRTNDALNSSYPHSSLAGYTDWRVPTPHELASLISNNCRSPWININAFPITEATEFWTSYEYSKFSSNQLTVDFALGRISRKLEDYHSHIRLVRNHPN